MKKILNVLFFGLLLFTSCEKDEEEVVTETKTRRAAAINKTPLATTSGRRSAPVASKYKVVSTLEK